jgi:glycosyltransferase involved in cell wall biosynthesis
LPEVAGEAALYSSARDPVEFAAALRQAFCDEDVRAEMIGKGYKNCRRFDWNEAAARTLAIYEQSGVNATRKAVFA